MQGTLVRTMIPKYGEKRMAIVALSGEGIGALLIFFAPVFWMLFPIVFIQSAVVSFIFSTMSTLAANRVSEREQGQLAGVSAAVSGLVAALGPLWAGAVYDYVMPGAPFWMGAILLGAACLLMAQVKNKAPQEYMTNIVSSTD
jgi:DHA1 family tetracycline resistance protein-like MFS transporter